MNVIICPEVCSEISSFAEKLLLYEYSDAAVADMLQEVDDIIFRKIAAMPDRHALYRHMPSRWRAYLYRFDKLNAFWIIYAETVLNNGPGVHILAFWNARRNPVEALNLNVVEGCSR